MANSPAREAVDVGSVIAGTYKIEALLGRGGMGAVFLASHQRLAGRHVAIKILHTEIEDADVVARFKREAEIAARLNHPNIVGVIDYNVSPDGTPYLVLDYLEGETLAQRIARGPMSLDQVTSILRQVGSALAAAHRAGIVHRDLKPQNIFLVPTEVDGRMVEIAKVLDFGISKIRGSQTVKTQDSALLGTPQYMAPEQAMGQHASVDERTDVFALGAIVYEMLSGRAAFAGASIPEVVFKVVYEQPAALDALVPALPAAVTTAVARAMAKPADERFAGVTGFVEAVTGQPLTLSRGQAAGMAPAGAESPSSARRVATGEAFAQTMGSGDHADAMLATAAPGSVVPATAFAAGTASPRPLAAGTAASKPLATGTASPTASQPGRVAAEPTVGVRGGSRGRSKAIGAVVLAVAAAAAGVAYLATRDSTGSGRARHTDVASTEPQRPDPRAAGAGSSQGEQIAMADTARTAGAPSAAAPGGAMPAAAAPAAAAAPPAAEPAAQPATQVAASDPRPAAKPAAKPAAPAPTAVAVADHAATSKHSAASTAGGGAGDARHLSGAHAALPAASAAADSDADGDEDAKDKLKQAAAALEAKNYDLAERLANAVINSPGSPRQHATARMIHGSVQCIARNDQEAAQIDLRNLTNFPNLRGRLHTTCKNHGVIQ